MRSVSLGPLAVPMNLLLMVAAFCVAAGVGLLAGRGRKTGIGNTLTDMLIVAAISARIAFVALWFDLYRVAPWSMLDIRDGGFTPWAAIGAALLLALWRGWRRPVLRQPLFLALAAALLVWGAVFVGQRLTEKPGMPATSLTTLAGVPADLSTLAAGKPLVVNLWATWCPPCRREMPVLAAAQERETGVRFVFVNQGEGAPQVLRFLAAGQLDLASVLMDPGSRLGRAVGSAGLPTTLLSPAARRQLPDHRAVGSAGLPTTLFYDAGGRLVDTHLGELSAASLASKLNRLRPQNR
jgi:thiol-disulfide isomerase/thioredoxin